jgi:hypothetical protein
MGNAIGLWFNGGPQFLEICSAIGDTWGLSYVIGQFQAGSQYLETHSVAIEASWIYWLINWCAFLIACKNLIFEIHNMILQARGGPQFLETCSNAKASAIRTLRNFITQFPGGVQFLTASDLIIRPISRAITICTVPIDEQLKLACQQGDFREVRINIKLDTGIVNYQGIIGFTPALWCCMGGDADISQYLIEQHANLVLSTECVGGPLHMAVWSNNLKCVEVLLRNGVALDATNVGGSTALHLACQRGSLPMVKLLVQAGALIEITNEIADGNFDFIDNELVDHELSDEIINEIKIKIQSQDGDRHSR